METGEGELWMLPIGVAGDCIWYSEENMERFQISTDDFQTMDSFINLSKKVKEQTDGTIYRAYVETPANFFSELQS